MVIIVLTSDLSDLSKQKSHKTSKVLSQQWRALPFRCLRARLFSESGPGLIYETQEYICRFNDRMAWGIGFGWRGKFDVKVTGYH